MNNRLGVSAFAVCVVLVAASSSAQHAAPGDDGISSLDWMAGCWTGDGGEECWLEPLGGTMLGVNRGPGREGQQPSFEFLRIVEEGGEVVLLASPAGRYPPTPFRAVELDETHVVFSNPQHDFPQRITYWLDTAGGTTTLRARVEAEEGGEWNGFEMAWTRAPWSGE